MGSCRGPAKLQGLRSKSRLTRSPESPRCDPGSWCQAGPWASVLLGCSAVGPSLVIAARGPSPHAAFPGPPPTAVGKCHQATAGPGSRPDLTGRGSRRPTWGDTSLSSCLTSGRWASLSDQLPGEHTATPVRHPVLGGSTGGGAVLRPSPRSGAPRNPVTLTVTPPVTSVSPPLPADGAQTRGSVRPRCRFCPCVRRTLSSRHTSAGTITCLPHAPHLRVLDHIRKKIQSPHEEFQPQFLCVSECATHVRVRRRARGVRLRVSVGTSALLLDPQGTVSRGARDPGLCSAPAEPSTRSWCRGPDSEGRALLCSQVITSCRGASWETRMH